MKSIEDIIKGRKSKKRVSTPRQLLVETFLKELNGAIELNNMNNKTSTKLFTFGRFNYLFPPTYIADEELHYFLGECRRARNFEAFFRWKVRYGKKENKNRTQNNGSVKPLEKFSTD